MSKRIDKLNCQWLTMPMTMNYDACMHAERGWMRGEKNKSCKVNKRESYYDKRKWSSVIPIPPLPVTCFQHLSESSRTKNIAHRARLQVSQNKKAKKLQVVSSRKHEKIKIKKGNKKIIPRSDPIYNLPKSPSMREDWNTPLNAKWLFPNKTNKNRTVKNIPSEEKNPITFPNTKERKTGHKWMTIFPHTAALLHNSREIHP